ncbi:hypothetical protein C8R47DRAFT_1198044 [Mycena vitilis]|nr:hypothetical protein C8R47DRAFT_1198044 [Mycena vitilis]
MDSAIQLISGNTLISSRLPGLEIAALRKEEKFYTVGASSETTKLEVAPAILVPISSDELSGYMEHEKLKEALGQERQRTAVEKSHILDTEGDVERATHLYLVHGIDLIMQDYVHKNYGKQITVICSSQVTKDNARTDILWKIGEKTVLVLEMKRCSPGDSHVIMEEHWSPIILRETVDPNITDPTEKKDALVKLITQERESLNDDAIMLTDNALPLAKQAAKYSRTHNAPVVLLFDWQKLILLDLPAKAKKDNFTAQNPARIFFSEEGLGEGNVEWTHRKVLVAAFMMALKKVMG